MTRTLVLIYGTRPDAIKLGPVAYELRAMGHEVIPICTGQHTDLLRGTPAETDLHGDVSLGLTPTDHPFEWVEHAKAPIVSTLRALSPDAVVVQGDTSSALAGTRAANALNFPLIHVEAGVRSGCLTDPFPEEKIRREIDHLSDLLLAPTDHCYQNLLNECHDLHARNTRAIVTGNTGISALHRYTGVHIGSWPRPDILITLHRREFRLSPNCTKALYSLLEGAEKWNDLTFIWPVHPAMRPYLPEATAIPRNVLLTDPLLYSQCAYLASRVRGILTDSGGLSEEAAALGVPCVHARFHTDRPEAVEAGIAHCLPPTPEGFHEAIQFLAEQRLPRRPSDCFGTADAATNVARAITEFLR